MTNLITVRGFVATKPDPRTMPGNGTAVASFRLASTPRWYDAQAKEWKDGHTNWYTVTAFRALAGTVTASVQVGQPVIVQGKLRVKTWESGGIKRSTVEIEALSVGHDLAFGTASFARSSGPQPGERRQDPRESGSGWDTGPASAGSLPSEVETGTGEWVDARTGQILEDPADPADPTPETGRTATGDADEDSAAGPEPTGMSEADEEDGALAAMS
ncbi:single-stranded DNA-binding protein [Rothia kristinae]|uniref:single-stranded DNA-binding protein n=1 Tax=Rothia kristinae TaxID=37923 RepID=UPI002448FC3C|nr:single-stranded DNA-binding protein [Rothia kristinae]WGH10253.1 single-stranded DNA-binding protein [Rothia kristinae]